jgi:phosphomannomutase
VEVAVPLESRRGIILTASQPKQWNALKLLNEKENFLMVSGENPCYR